MRYGDTRWEIPIDAASPGELVVRDMFVLARPFGVSEVTVICGKGWTKKLDPHFPWDTGKG